MQRIIRYTVGGLTTLGVLAAIGTGIAMAQDDDGPGAVPPSSPFAFASGQGVVTAALNGDVGDDFLKRLSGKLGIDETKLHQAIVDAEKDQLDAAVKSGKIPQEIADKIRKGIETGDGFPFGTGILPPIVHAFGDSDGPGTVPSFGAEGPGWTFHIGPFGDDFDFPIGGPRPFGPFGSEAGVAKFLGIAEQQYTSELNAGKTPAEVAAAHGKSRADFKAFLVSERTKEIQSAVDAGRLTAGQASKLREGVDRSAEAYLDAHIRISIAHRVAALRQQLVSNRAIASGRVHASAAPGCLFPIHSAFDTYSGGWL